MSDTKLISPTHHFTVDGVTLNVYHANKGEGLPKHEHTFQHGTVCYSGKLMVRKENLEFVMDPMTKPVMLKENEWHELEALEDGTCFSNIFRE